MNTGLIEDFRQYLAAAHNVVVFTGAGISTESGIPDFRSPGGTWSRMGPIYFDDFVTKEEARREAWRRVFADDYGVSNAKPNEGHYAVARLVAQGKARTVITQNIDNLHQASGVPVDRIVELHGNASFAKCLDCGLRHELDSLKQTFLGRDEIPTCRSCGGLVKTATISFGQTMPEAEMERARVASEACDLFIVLGSSLVVYPAAGFPMVAKRAGATLVIVNRDETEQDSYADLVIRDGIGRVMSAAVPVV